MDNLSKQLRKIARDMDRDLDPPDDSAEETRAQDLAQLQDAARSSHQKALEYFEEVENYIHDKHYDIHYDEDAGEVVGVSDEFMNEATSIALDWFRKDPDWAMDKLVIIPDLCDLDKDFKKDLTQTALEMDNPIKMRAALDYLKKNDLLHVEYVETDSQNNDAPNLKVLIEFLRELHAK